MANPVHILIAYHSVKGQTEDMARAVAQGAESVEGVAVSVHPIDDVSRDMIMDAHAIVLGSPVYWNNMTAQVKAFLDRWQLEWDVFPDLPFEDKVGAAFVTGGKLGSGTELTMLSILAAFMHNRLVIVSGADGYGASAATEGDPKGVTEEGWERGRFLGERVAKVTRKLHGGD